MIRRQLTLAGDLDLETFYCKVNLSFFLHSFLLFFGGEGGCIHPQSQWVSGAGASQLSGAGTSKLSAVLIARYTGVE